MKKSPYNSIESLPLFLSIKDVSNLLGIGINQAYALIHSNRIKSIKVGNQYRIAKQAFLEFADLNQ